MGGEARIPPLDIENEIHFQRVPYCARSGAGCADGYLMLAKRALTAKHAKNCRHDREANLF